MRYFFEELGHDVHSLLKLINFDVAARAEEKALFNYPVHSFVFTEELLIELLDLEVFYGFV